MPDFNCSAVLKAMAVPEHIRCVTVLGDQGQGKTRLVQLLKRHIGVSPTLEAGKLRPPPTLSPESEQGGMPHSAAALGSTLRLEVHTLLLRISVRGEGRSYTAPASRVVDRRTTLSIASTTRSILLSNTVMGMADRARNRIQKKIGAEANGSGTGIGGARPSLSLSPRPGAHDSVPSTARVGRKSLVAGGPLGLVLPASLLLAQETSPAGSPGGQSERRHSSKANRSRTSVSSGGEHRKSSVSSGGGHRKSSVSSSGEHRKSSFSNSRQYRKSSMLLDVAPPKPASLLCYLLDAPGHADFTSEAVAALRLSDGALIVLDAGCVVQRRDGEAVFQSNDGGEGASAQRRSEHLSGHTEELLRAALSERVRPVLVVTGLDRFLPGGSLAFGARVLEGRLRASVQAVNSALEDAAAMGVDELREDSSLAPELGDVVFGCTWSSSLESEKHQKKGKEQAGGGGGKKRMALDIEDDDGTGPAAGTWMLSIPRFAGRFAEKFGVRPDIMARRLWHEEGGHSGNVSISSSCSNLERDTEDPDSGQTNLDLEQVEEVEGDSFSLPAAVSLPLELLQGSPSPSPGSCSVPTPSLIGCQVGGMALEREGGAQSSKSRSRGPGRVPQATTKAPKGGKSAPGSLLLKLVLEPLVQLSSALGADANAPDWQRADVMLRGMGLVLSEEDRKLSGQALVAAALRRFANGTAAEVLVELLRLRLPSPQEAQAAGRSEHLLVGPADGTCSRALHTCDPKGPLMVSVARLLPAAEAGSSPLEGGAASSGSRFFALGRVFSGSVTAGRPLRVHSLPGLPGGGAIAAAAVSGEDRDPRAAALLGEDIASKVESAWLPLGDAVEILFGSSSPGSNADDDDDVASVPCGNLVLLRGPEDFLMKAGTLVDASVEPGTTLARMHFGAVRPAVRVSVRPGAASELPRLVAALRRLSQVDPIASCKPEEWGEYVISGAGPSHLSACLDELRAELLSSAKALANSTSDPHSDDSDEPVSPSKSLRLGSPLQFQGRSQSEAVSLVLARPGGQIRMLGMSGRGGQSQQRLPGPGTAKPPPPSSVVLHPALSSPSLSTPLSDASPSPGPVSSPSPPERRTSAAAVPSQPASQCSSMCASGGRRQSSAEAVKIRDSVSTSGGRRQSSAEALKRVRACDVSSPRSSRSSARSGASEGDEEKGASFHYGACYRETVLGHGHGQPPVESKVPAPGGSWRLQASAGPLGERLCADMEEGHPMDGVHGNATRRAQLLSERYDWAASEVRQVWCFGPADGCGANAFFRPTGSAAGLLGSASGWLGGVARPACCWAASEGGLCEEPLRNVCFRLALSPGVGPRGVGAPRTLSSSERDAEEEAAEEDWASDAPAKREAEGEEATWNPEEDPSHLFRRQMGAATRRCLLAAQLAQGALPSLQEPVFRTELVLGSSAPQGSIAALRREIGALRGVELVSGWAEHEWQAWEESHEEWEVESEPWLEPPEERSEVAEETETETEPRHWALESLEPEPREPEHWAISATASGAEAPASQELPKLRKRFRTPYRLVAELPAVETFSLRASLCAALPSPSAGAVASWEGLPPVLSVQSSFARWATIPGPIGGPEEGLGTCLCLVSGSCAACCGCYHKAVVQGLRKWRQLPPAPRAAVSFSRASS